ncbi:MAG: MutS-related protein [Alphaproteobacteria bacterium]
MDEIGRGTATFGLSIAWLSTSTRSQSPPNLVATHYHDLTNGSKLTG